MKPIEVALDYPVRSLKKVLVDMAIIAEVKYATPSEGNLGISHDASYLAREYEALGAAAISCLTEPKYFEGDIEYISRIRSACSLPVLMKDFIVDERQITAGRQAGADAFLLITEMLSIEECERLFLFGKGRGMDCLVEVHGKDGLEKALYIGADIIGVNVRNLSTLKVHPNLHEEMIGHIPSGITKVAESSITSGRRIRELKDIGYDAALVGRAMANNQTRLDVFSCG
ncbi:MAG: indole-3-glycerol-phosphate synthase [Deltaproteobacteria bacterium]|nr:indole-3-glycerol-phosphate synthase [Deltaproteobacteria bacterium]